MPVNVAINGFGRIGRLVFRALHEQRLLGSLVNVVAVGDIVGADVLAYLLTFDSVQGRFTAEPTYATTDDELQRARTANRKPKPDLLTVDGRTIRVISAREPAGLPWQQLGVDVVIESTGRFTDATMARGHLTAGARKVIITAPGKGEDKTIVMGVNHPEYNTEQHHVVSNASCTTNCLAPLVHVLLTEQIGIEEGLMTTVHSYTASQKTVDGPDEQDWRGGRSAAINIIPSGTGAAKAVALVCPAVKGKLTGMAFRVPTPTVSVVDLTVRTTAETSLEQITAAMRRASQTYLKGILEVTCDEVVSSDFIHSPASSTFDVGASIELNNRFFKLVSWYDNEWGYSNRVADLLKLMVEKWL